VLALAFAYTSRPPTATELYANGVHVATGAFELGDPDLGVERSGSVDLSFRRTIGRVTGSVGGYYVRFHDYVTLVPTGDVFEAEEEDHDDHEEEEHGEDEHGHGHFDGPIPVFAYRGLGAEFFGMEAEATVRVLEHAAHAVDVEMRSDYVHARDRRSGRPLPRISPFRFGGGVAYGFDRFRSRVDVFHVRKQDRIAMNELPTDGYVMLDVGGGYSWPIARSELELWVRGTNLLDEEARNHVSFLKDLAPLGGRGVAGGMRLVF
jgi:iron complex outermembrane recepter protein